MISVMGEDETSYYNQKYTRERAEQLLNCIQDCIRNDNTALK